MSFSTIFTIFGKPLHRITDQLNEHFFVDPNNIWRRGRRSVVLLECVELDLILSLFVVNRRQDLRLFPSISDEISINQLIIGTGYQLVRTHLIQILIFLVEFSFISWKSIFCMISIPFLFSINSLV